MSISFGPCLGTQNYAPQFNEANDDVDRLVHIFGLLIFNLEVVEECFTDYFMAQKPENAAIAEVCNIIIY